MKLSFPESGLLPAIVQDALTGQVRMLAYVNRDALERTLKTGLATFWSRSRNAIWVKGETSENVLHVRSLHADCDADAILMLVDPVGPTCHTGAPACFFRRVREDGTAEEEGVDATPFLERLERTIEARWTSTVDLSYTKHLLEGGASQIGHKLREEANELAVALEHESSERVVGEAADLLYHAMVALALRGVPLEVVLAELERRTKKSGHQEKRERGQA